MGLKELGRGWGLGLAGVQKMRGLYEQNVGRLPSFYTEFELTFCPPFVQILG